MHKEIITKEQLIAYITTRALRIKPDKQVNEQLRIEAGMNKRILEIALAVLTAPDDIPPRVLDAMSDMCDGGFDSQGIWDLCRESIMPPTPCSHCGAVLDRPGGASHYHTEDE
ncbi:hypothetical protein [Enterobacter soli]|uniref:hypothetical protein n=1 Tax=Enterobacter soli TaxID=885040 RepID=UPI002F40737C